MERSPPTRGHVLCIVSKIAASSSIVAECFVKSNNNALGKDFHRLYPHREIAGTSSKNWRISKSFA